MIARAPPLGEPERVAKPLDRRGHVVVDELGDYGARRHRPVLARLLRPRTPGAPRRVVAVLNDPDQIPGRVAERREEARAVGDGSVAQSRAGIACEVQSGPDILDVDPAHGPGVGRRRDR